LSSVSRRHQNGVFSHNNISSEPRSPNAKPHLRAPTMM
jgi:hypothetical protein